LSAQRRLNTFFWIFADLLEFVERYYDLVPSGLYVVEYLRKRALGAFRGYVTQ
jgi:hypothetical protein